MSWAPTQNESYILGRFFVDTLGTRDSCHFADMVGCKGILTIIELACAVDVTQQMDGF